MVRLIEKILYLLGFLYVPLASFISEILSIDGKAWVRHSVYFNKAIFGISDIDITYLGEDHHLVIKKYKKLKSILPVLGEINCYRKNDLPLLAKCHNILELKRDPVLLNQLKPLNDDKKKVSTIVYLLRCAESDKANLMKWPLLRKRKWEFHFLEIEKYLSKTFLRDTNEIVKILSDNKICLDNCDSLFPFIYPHIWIRDHYSENELLELSDRILVVPDLIKDVFIGQLSFEFCGVLSQVSLIEDKASIVYHFNNIKKLILNIETKEAKNLLTSINSFQKREPLNS